MDVSLDAKIDGRVGLMHLFLSRSAPNFSLLQHVCADTLRSVAVLVAAGFAFLLPQIQPDVADSVAAIIVSLIILGSLLPLLQGLCLTTLELYSLLKQRA